MIESFNRLQAAKTVGALLLGTATAAITLTFFYWTALVVLSGMGAVNRQLAAWTCALLALGLVMVVGLMRGTQGRGHYNYAESGLMPGFDESTASGFVANRKTMRLTAPAYLLGQLFLASPLQFLQAKRHWERRLPDEHGLESNLHALLTEIESVGKWHDAQTYDTRMRELLFLVRLGRVEFSPRKGRVRFAARS